MKNYRLLLWATMLACSVTLEAKVTLPQLFQNGMVMQRNKAIPVWGKADAGEAVAVTLNKKKVETTADADGRWRVDLPKMKAGGPFQLTVNELTIDNVLIGDVWLLSGQSNIDVTIERVYPNYTDEIDHFSLDKVRLFRVQNETSTHGVKDDIRPTNINWKPLTKENAWFFSLLPRQAYVRGDGCPSGRHRQQLGRHTHRGMDIGRFSDDGLSYVDQEVSYLPERPVCQGTGTGQ